MSPENITEFQAAVAADPALQAKIQTIHADAIRESAKKMAALSVEVGLPFTAEEFLTHLETSGAELSEDELEGVSGGFDLSSLDRVPGAKLWFDYTRRN